jgi:hypothetical protein
MNKCLGTPKLLPVIFVCLLTQGCVGVAVNAPKSHTVAHPSFYNSPGVFNVGPESAKGPTTEEWLRAHWGEPAKIKHLSKNSRDETWTYEFRTMPYGVVLFIIGPIPLELPIGHEKVIVSVEDGVVTKASYHFFPRRGWVAGMSTEGWKAGTP